MSNELAQLFPTGKELSIRDENLTIKPFKFGELPRVFKAIEPLTVTLATMMSTKQLDVSAIGTLLAEGGDNVLDLIAIGARKPRAWVDQLELDEGIDVLAAVLEVNADFFVHKVLPRLTQVMEKNGGRT